ncbi:inositol polyphosphate kinase family protein [Endozoicomonas sp.]|uniref:inositol polyphosphate kinase family protein n=1 Tax=Endozoicomonas sp. TaxID=1892382 RepID=UPI002884F95A|nr:inositol polyphosphate kinase family protein [Endozoicomonas sp.]
MNHLNGFSCFNPAGYYLTTQNNAAGIHNGTIVSKSDNRLQLATTAGHSVNFTELSDRYVSKICKQSEFTFYKERISNGLDTLIPHSLSNEKFDSLEPLERTRLDSTTSSTKNTFIVMENLKNGLRTEMLFELDIKIGYKSASKQDLAEQKHPHPLLKRLRHRFLDTAYRSTTRGWRIEGITINGQKVHHSKLRFAFSAKHFLQTFMDSLPTEKQKLILAKIKQVSDQLKDVPQDFIGSSILITTDSTEKSECKVHLIDFAHALPKNNKHGYSEVAKAASHLYEKLKTLIENE